MEDEIAVLKGAICTDAYDYNSFCKLIQSLRSFHEQAGSDDSRTDLEIHRSIFAARFLPDAEYWMSWVNDRISLAGATVKDFSELDDLFHDAISQCPNVEIANEWIENAFNRYEADLTNEEALIGILETAINACGADIMTGAGLWSRLIDIHLENLEDLTDTAASPDAIQSAKEKIVSTYRRQFALPLLGNQRSMSKFESVLSDICIESDAQWIRPEVLLEKFHRSEEQLAARIIYEQNVLSEEFSSSSLDDQVTAWKTYIRFEIDEKELSRAHRLYERSVLTCHQCIELWTEFADFAATTLKEWPLVASVTGRAVKVHRSQIQLWLQHFLAIEAAGPPSSSSSASQKSPQILSSSFAELSTKKENMGDHTTQSTEQKLMLSIQTALTCSFYTADDYLSVLLYSCDYRRRLLKHHLLQANHLVESAKSVDPESTTLMRTTLIGAVTALRNSFMEAENFLNVYYPEWGSGWLQLYKYNSSVEDEIIGDVAEILENDALNSESPDDSTTDLSSNAGNIWEKSVTRFSKYFFSWGEYITWGRAAGDFELCRSLYCRALKAVKDLPEELCQAYLLFERQAGTISDYCTARARTKTILKNAAQKASKALLFAKEQSKAKSLKKMAKIPDTLVSSVVINSHSDAKEKKTLAENHVSEDHMSEEGAIETVGHSQRKRDFSEHITSDSSNVVTTSDHAIDTNKRSKGADSAAHISSSSGVKTIETCWVCIKNLSFKSTIDAVLDLFKPCGEIEEGVLLLTKAGNSRGQATIHYFDSSSALKAVQLNGALIDERPVEVELDFSHESEVTGQANSSSTKAVSAHHPTTVFVSKFSKDLTSDQLRAMFLECGDILEARVIVDKRTGQSKCHGLVQFYEEAGKKAALCLNKKEINSQVISVLPSKFGAVVEGASIYGPNSGSASDRKDEVAAGSTKDSNKMLPPMTKKSLLHFKPRRLAIQTHP